MEETRKQREIGFRAACELLREDMQEDKYGIGNMCSQWTAAEIADDLESRMNEALGLK